MRRLLLLILGLGLTLTVVSTAATIHVPDDHATIQAGINAATDGDTVLVAAGVYSECISFVGKDIMVMSSSGPMVTEIVASESGTPVVSFVNNEPRGATISGFTIKGSSNASGILCEASSPTIINNDITGNIGPGGNFGGGITLYNTSGSLIRGNVIHGNSASGYGGAIHVGDDDANSTDDVISYNVIYSNEGAGDIRVLGSVVGLEVSNNTISVITWSGILAQGGSITARNNIVFYAPRYGMQSAGGTILAEYNCTFDNGNDYNFVPGAGNIYKNAKFVDVFADDYRLLPESPCIDAGDPTPQYNDPDGTRNDMGAYPSLRTDYPLIVKIGFGSGDANGYVVIAWPTIYWHYLDTAATTQTQFEIEVGIDQDWSVAEMWRSGAVASSDTSAVYAGAPLANREVYYLRIRAANSSGWGGWSQTVVRMGIKGTIHVPADYSSIQAGINGAFDGDTVLIAAGAYSEALTVQNKGIVLLSESGPEHTVLISAGRMSLSQSAGTTIDGFRFIDGSTIGISGGSVTVRNCQFFNNDNVIVGDNSAVVRVYRCLFRNNLANPIVSTGPSCEFVNNTVDASARGIAVYGSNAVIRNNIVTNMEWYGIWNPASSSVVDYNDFYQNNPDYGYAASAGPHDISLDPQYVDTSTNDYRIPITSPCHDAGDPAPEYNDPDGTRNDMGAYFSVAGNYPLAGNVNFGSGSVVGYATEPWPTIYWNYLDTAVTMQTRFEIEIGTDRDWSVAEMWQPGAITSSDTSVVYAGAPLMNHAMYFLRMRVANGSGWGDWSQIIMPTRIGGTIRVPLEQPTIQAGVNLAVDGDTVLVAPGLYSENLLITGKGICLFSEEGAGSTSITPATTTDHIVTLKNVAGKSNTIRGFRLTGVQGMRCIASYGGASTAVEECDVVDNVIGNTDGDDAGAILVRGTGVIRNNRFINNRGGFHGGGVRIVGAGNSIIEHNEFRYNSAIWGGGIDLLYANNVMVRFNLFVGDSAAGYGGAIYLGGASAVIMTNNTIDSCVSLNNTGAGISFWACDNNLSFDNIVTNCRGYGIWQAGSYGYLTEYDDCWANLPANYSGITPGTGSLSLDPQFAGGTPFNYHLRNSSPCINAGNPDPAYNDPDGSRNDMGCYANLPLAAFSLLLPADQRDSSVETLTPVFSWQAATNSDTTDPITYTMYIATDSQFVYAIERADIVGPECTLDFDLTWSTRYWWKVKATSERGSSIWCNATFTFRTSTLGDVNDNGMVDVVDAVFLVNYIFLNGPAPRAFRFADCNCDGRINVGDIVCVIRYLFWGGRVPCCTSE